MQYKQLGEQDINHALNLMQVFAVAFDDLDYTTNLPTNSYLNPLLSNPQNIILVAINENAQVVGGIVAFELRLLKNTSQIYLYDLAVAQEYRRKGIATSLINHLKQIAVSRKAETIFVQADNEDAPAIELYTKIAGRGNTDVTHFDIPLTINMANKS